jgi:hypothetical protein
MRPLENTERYVRTESTKATYTACIADFTPAATATDFATLIGATGKLITLTNIRMTATQTGSSYLDMYLYKRTTLNTGGTATATAIVNHDSVDPAASATVSQYSANPSALGTGVLLRSDRTGVPATASVTGTCGIIWEFANRSSKAPKLQNANESFALSFGGQAVPAGLSYHISVEWTEE